MNWKNVAFLVSVERKSGRLIRGRKLTRFRENKVIAYAFYLIALSIGAVVGALVGSFYNTLVVLAEPALAVDLQPLLLGIFAALPTIVLIYSIVFTMLNQIQRSGVKATTQAPYWLPITWQEQTLAAITSQPAGLQFG